MKRRTRIALAAAAALFLALFAARLVHELGRGEVGPYQGPAWRGEAMVQDLSLESAPRSKRNYASAKIAIAQPSAPAQVLDQKYEQVATLSASSGDFEADSRRIEEAASAAKAVVQRRDAYGLPGSRFLSLSLGVVPAAFDSTIDALRAIGKLESVTVNKTDRTGDYKALEARRLSLEKTRDGLAALRRAGAGLADLVALETKILEIEGQIQELGVSLGDFSEGNSFCTIDATLREVAPGAAARAFLRAALEAFGWAAGVTAGIAFAGLAAAGAAALAALAWERLRRKERPEP
ncbi:MAG TPA: DUF4349 domain-containing protein [Spirochaetales bacterium]|nr:DUF4349 domain-containing protein [Spirochaetales bacterium]HRY55513.1 DUF4349 domain-containing protein [Spirochaetia bacterium]